MSKITKKSLSLSELNPKLRLIPIIENNFAFEHVKTPRFGEKPGPLKQMSADDWYYFYFQDRLMKNLKKRCFGGGPGKELYADYHDNEWGIPLHDDKRLFEMLILEGAQAGLSWETILKRREGYRKAFYDFDPVRVASMSDDELEALRHNEGIIRNRLKIYAARQNAQVFLKIQQEFGSFDRYVWGFVKDTPIKNHRKHLKDVPASTAESDALSKDLKKRGMTFVGSTIIYAYMQAIGMVNDHIIECWRSS